MDLPLLFCLVSSREVRALSTTEPVDIPAGARNTLYPMNFTLFPILCLVALALYYVVYFKRRASAGPGGDSPASSLAFGFDPEERVVNWWLAVLYVGPLRPDVDDSSWVLAEVKGLRGQQCGVALSERGRVSVTPMSALGRAVYRSSSSGSKPIQLFSEQPRLTPGSEAFSEHLKLQKELGHAPRLRSSAGGVKAYELCHIVGPELPEGVTLWLDPAGATELKNRL